MAAALAAACHSKAGDDCAVIKSDPNNAMARFSQTHRNEADAVEAIENCIAPTGDTCVRAQMLLLELRKLMIMPAVFNQLDAYSVETECKRLEPEQRSCLIYSYMMRHRDECGDLLRNL